MSLALCIATGGKAMTLAVTLFTLSWTHSVEKIVWSEDWQVVPKGLHLLEARVKGSGAGMDPGEGARLVNGWWVWQPQLPIVPALHLAASGATISPWTLCHSGGCETLGAEPGAVVEIKPCDG